MLCFLSPSGFKKSFQSNPDKYAEHSRFTVRQCERRVDSGCVCKCVRNLGGLPWWEGLQLFVFYEVSYVKPLYGNYMVTAGWPIPSFVAFPKNVEEDLSLSTRQERRA